ncbi:MAG: type IV pilus inner membrane component PilO [Thermoleophilia bacterium]
MNIRKRDLAILAAIGLIALIALWYFFLISPKRSEISAVNEETRVEKETYDRNTARLKKLDQERIAAQESRGELLKLDKLIPGDEQIPSLIVELQKSANDAGIDFVRIEPDMAVTAADGTAVIPIQMKFEGRFFDVNEFLYRVENYARLEGNEVNVSGRFLSVVDIKLEEGEFKKWDYVTVTLGINAYTSMTPAGAAAPAGSSDTNDTAAAE